MSFWSKVGVSWSKVGVPWSKVGVSWSKVGVSWSKVGVSWSKAGVSWSKAGVFWSKVGGALIASVVSRVPDLYFVGIISLVINVIILILCAQDGDKKNNRFGKNIYKKRKKRK